VTHSQVPFADVGKTALRAALVQARESRKSRLFDDLSAQPHVCNSMTADHRVQGAKRGASADRR